MESKTIALNLIIHFDFTTSVIWNIASYSENVFFLFNTFIILHVFLRFPEYILFAACFSSFLSTAPSLTLFHNLLGGVGNLLIMVKENIL